MAVDAVEHAAVAGQQRAAVLESRPALELALDEVADDRDGRNRQAHAEPRQQPLAEDGRPGGGRHAGEQHARHETFPRLVRAHHRRELPAAEALAAEVGADVRRGDEHEEEEQQDPPLRLDQHDAREADRGRHQHRETDDERSPAPTRLGGSREPDEGREPPGGDDPEERLQTGLARRDRPGDETDDRDRRRVERALARAREPREPGPLPGAREHDDRDQRDRHRRCHPEEDRDHHARDRERGHDPLAQAASHWPPGRR